RITSTPIRLTATGLMDSFMLTSGRDALIHCLRLRRRTMINQMLYITSDDKGRLQRLLDNPDLMRQRPYLERLANRLENALSVVSSADVPANCVTMNSTARLIDLDSGDELVLTVVYPDDADVANGRVSVLAPV